MAESQIPSPATLRQLLRYCPETGALFWTRRDISFFPDKRAEVWWNGRFAGKMVARSLTPKGYLKVKIFGVRYLAHRVAWAVFHGEAPSGQIDHVNGVKDDNRIVNLRVVTATENQRNMRRSSRNKSGVTGVSFEKRTGKWVALISENGRQVHLGRFADVNEAIAARKGAERRFGYHPNHGRG